LTRAPQKVSSFSSSTAANTAIMKKLILLLGVLGLTSGTAPAFSCLCETADSLSESLTVLSLWQSIITSEVSQPYTADFRPPLLSLKFSDADVFSWSSISTDFHSRENSDLTAINWTGVTNVLKK
jgi:hypothetical protein